MHLKQRFIRNYITIILATFILITAPLTIAVAGSADRTPIALTAAVSAKLSSSLFTEENIRSSNTPITITLKGATWNSAALSSSSSANNFMKGFVAASQPEQWKLVQSAKIDIIYINSSTLTLSLPPIPAYDITYDQVISVTIPKSFITGATSDLPAGSFTVKCDTAPYSISLEDAIRTGTLTYWLSYTSPYDILINVPERHVNTISISQQKLGNVYITIVDVTTDNKVESVSVTWNNITHSAQDYISSGDTRTFSVGFADIPPGADIIIRAKDKYGNPMQKDITEKIKTGQTTYNELPKSPLHGWHTLYSLVTNKKLLDSILSYYSLSELKIGVR